MRPSDGLLHRITAGGGAACMDWPQSGGWIQNVELVAHARWCGECWRPR